MAAQLVLAKNSIGTSSIIQMNSEVDTIFIDLVVANAILSREENDLIFRFDDDTQISLYDFYSLFTQATLPDFDIEGTLVDGKTFFDALGVSELLPAFGDHPDAVMGSGISNYENTIELIEGIDALDSTNVFDGSFADKYIELMQANVEPHVSIPVGTDIQFNHYTDGSIEYVFDNGTTSVVNGLASIEGTAGNDIVTGGDLSGKMSIINTGDGDDTVTIKNMFGGIIDTGNGNDTIKIDMMSGTNATIRSGLGSDYITVATMLGGSINSGAGADEITITTLNGGTINSGDGNDIIEIGTMNDVATVGPISTMSGTNSFITSGLGSDYITVATMLGGTINSGAGADEITITTMSGGDIFSEEGDDIIIVDTMNGGTINSGEGNDIIDIGLMDGGNIVAMGTSTIDIDTFTAGVIITGENGDEIVIHNLMSGGVIQSGAGDDIVTIATMLGGSIDGGAGNDTLYFSDKFTNDFNFQFTDGVYNLHEGSTKTGEIRNFEKIQFSDMDDSVVFDDTQNITIDMGAGNDTITLSGVLNGSTINTGSGDDTIRISDDLYGNTIDGGSGVDTLVFVNNDDSVSSLVDSIKNIEIFEFQGNSVIDFSGTDYDMSSIIVRDTSDDGITIKASATGSIIDGGAGADTIIGNIGNDIIVYDPNDTNISGGEGIDVLLVGDNPSFDFDTAANVSEMEIAIAGIDGAVTPEFLAEHGIFMDATGEGTVILGDGWETNNDGSYTHTEYDFILTTSSDFADNVTLIDA